MAKRLSLAARFEKTFSRGCEFWTGEDGMLMSVVIARIPDWAEILESEYEHLWCDDEKFDASRGVEKFVSYEYHRDPENFPSSRKVWRLSEEVTQFPVIEYELAIPR